ncbi:phage tail protein [Flavobacterium jejuense]|jgi:phage tail-like protein|uniref:Phage tail protein n=1 Tax=Flavobacterium jejuense TaxID=1544455 RepID=A0ABX0IX31_9FLAO|nr:phage tail protein [Flavobacterium jejuense]NHN27088.1 phage tail protein [Flavobacterium jejuense]
MPNTNFPLPKFHFSVQWGGSKIAFTEVSGLNKEMDVIEHRVGSSPNFYKEKMPGMQKLSNITLKRGVFLGDNEFYDWYNTVAQNTVEKRTITISLLDENQQPKVVWTVKDCFIVSLKCTDLKSDANEAAIDTVEVANHGVDVLFKS